MDIFKRLNFNINLLYNEKKYNIDHLSIKAIAIGGSAGSLQNMIKIISKLPKSNISVFIVMHILPDEKSNLVKIIKQYTTYNVIEASNNLEIKKDTIYIAKPNYHMEVKNSRVYIHQKPPVNFCRPAIDTLFKSLAFEYKDSLMAILTCGYLDDGSRALEDIKRNNGIVIIQNPNQCEANDMPLNAIITKNYDKILDIDDINILISEKLDYKFNLDIEIKQFIKKIDETYGYDFSNYDKNSLIRRIELLKQELKVQYFTDFEYLVLNNSDIFQLLFKKLSINVSEFFRDDNMYIDFIENIIPILATYPHIRIWCSACSKGQEAYSIAMILDKFNLLKKTIIYATDFNSLIVDQAKNALYSKIEYEQAKSNYDKLKISNSLDNWFENKNGYYEVKEDIKKSVQFFQHNLVTDGIINEFNIVFCRNVLIYFDDKLQNKVIDLIYESLIRNGYLILGNSEHIENKDKFQQENYSKYSKIFKRIGAL